ncbi:11063_t:CDS:1 [Diversispora eburnea]|uniref:11063_t:CDS:1 n=1 Tax=Diversispora eburnea TaxID=1213867 RepID=A0A9N9ASG8_9GLOM|nr:11063_t:CDS:1 [Diversispora eburnea]
MDELDVPFFCPTSYSYSSPEVHTACVIRVLNLFVMWLYTILLILSIFAWCCGFLPSEEDFYFKEKFLTSTGLSSLSFGNSSTWSATWGQGQGQGGSNSKVGVIDEENPSKSTVESTTSTNPFYNNNESSNIIKTSYIKGEKGEKE